MSVHHAAALACCLPQGSALLSAQDPRLSYTETDYLLLAIVNMLISEPFDPFAEMEKKEAKVSMTVDQLQEFLSRPRTEVKNGN